jgi:hypothetical protein
MGNAKKGIYVDTCIIVNLHFLKIKKEKQRKSRLNSLAELKKQYANILSMAIVIKEITVIIYMTCKVKWLINRFSIMLLVFASRI